MLTREQAVELAARKFPKGPEAVAASLGAAVELHSLRGCDGWCVAAPGRIIITLNSARSMERRRFTLAHELAHLILGTDPELRSADAEPFSSKKQAEKEADRLAAELLLPRSWLLEQGLRPPIDGHVLETVAKRACVSQLAVACRLTALAKALGLESAAVVKFNGADVEWIWTTTLQVQSEAGVASLLPWVRAAAGCLPRRPVKGGKVLTAFEFGRPEQASLFVQVLSGEVGVRESQQEKLARVRLFLFEGQKKHEASVASSINTFVQAGKLSGDIKADFEAFLEHYAGKPWAEPLGDRLRSSDGQWYFELRATAPRKKVDLRPRIRPRRPE